MIEVIKRFNSGIEVIKRFNSGIGGVSLVVSHETGRPTKGAPEVNSMAIFLKPHEAVALALEILDKVITLTPQMKAEIVSLIPGGRIQLPVKKV